MTNLEPDISTVEEPTQEPGRRVTRSMSSQGHQVSNALDNRKTRSKRTRTVADAADAAEPIVTLNPEGFLSKTSIPISLRNDEFFTVINLSERDMTNSELSILSKGLNFTPTPNRVDRLKLKESARNFERSLRL